ncbi:MAG: hypothetical protein ABI361_08460 [Nitrososphaera sp.]
MNAKMTAMAASVAVAILMTALVAVGFSPVANNALAQVTNSSTTSTPATTASTGASFQLNPTSGKAGTSVTVTGSGFTANSTVSLTFDSSALTTSPSPVKASSGGTFSAVFTIPSNATSAGSHEIMAKDATHSASAILSVLASTSANSTSTASTSATTSSSASTTSAAGSSIVQQGTVASTNGNVTILSPRSDGAVFTGTISYAAGTSVQLFVLHAYGLASGQTVSGISATPHTIMGPDGKTYAVTEISNAGSTTGDSGSIVFSGNGLMLSATGSSSFIATYTLKASIDTPNIVNSLASTTATASSTSTATSSSSAAANSTSAPVSNSTATNSTTSSSSSAASITPTAGSANNTITVKGQGFPPNASIVTRETINGATTGPQVSASADSSGSFQIQLPLVSTIHGASISIQSSSGSVIARGTYIVP